ncbi:MAG: prepilin-type N-terminal cleavage/methylation domain-containing protein [Clostridia bacterium]|nr:prepilin-type N-terminal cleavage/methylation domain-containing protein [Clostridia bacterium]
MRNMKKKGFTIIELVVVVAVIAILAAVLIPTFSGIIAKARLNADEQTVTNMNKYVAMAAAEEDFEFAADAVNALYDNGFNVGKFKTFSKGYHYAYGGVENNKFYLLNKAGEIVFPENDATDTATLWGFFNNEKADYIPTVYNYIALSAVAKAELYNGYDCAFRSETAKYTFDLNGKALTVAAKGTNKNITLVNGAVLDTVADGYTLGKGAVAKGVATTSSINAIAPVNGVTTVKDVMITTPNSSIKFADGATKVVLENCTIDLSASETGWLKLGQGAANITSYELINCTFNLNAGNIFIFGNANNPDVTVKGCTISSGRGLVLGAEGGYTYGDIVIEGNTFIDNGSLQGKPSLQFAGAQLTADKISVKNNTFATKDIALRIHETVQAINCNDITLSGNEFAEGVVKIDGDGATVAQAIADAWLPKL